MADERPVRRRHGAELKAQVLAECSLPGASVAKVAMSHGLNANLVHGWRKLERERCETAPAPSRAPLVPAPAELPASTPQFVPLAMTTMASPEDAQIHIELRRGGVTMKLLWPMSAASQCAAWARELLK